MVDSEPGYTLWKNWRSVARELAFADDLGSFVGRSSDSMLLHVLDGDDASLVKHRDWLNGEDVGDFLRRVMRENLDRLEAEQETDDITQWASPMPTQHYTRLNTAFFTCEVARAAGMEAGCADDLPGNVRSPDFMNRGTYNHIVEFRPIQDTPATEDDGGDAAPMPATGAGAALLGLILLAGGGVLARPGGRRTLLLVAATSALLVVAASASIGGQTLVEERDGFVVEAESIISPGQSGFINQAGQESPHYRDQHELYANWQYKPMPLLEEDVRELGDGQVLTLFYAGP